MLRRWFSFGPHYQLQFAGEVREKVRDPTVHERMVTSPRIEDELDVHEKLSSGRGLNIAEERWRAHFADGAVLRNWKGWRIVFFSKMCIIRIPTIDAIKSEWYRLEVPYYLKNLSLSFSLSIYTHVCINTIWNSSTQDRSPIIFELRKYSEFGDTYALAQREHGVPHSVRTYRETE